LSVAADPEDRNDIDPDAALALLRGASDDLREEVAAEVTRKRAPELVFRIGNREAMQE
jgi:hypothetical protein